MTGLSPDQVALRRTGLGASEIAAVIGVDPYRNALDVFLEKTGQAQPFEGNEFTHWGNRLEAVIASEYADRRGVLIEMSTTLVHPDHPWMLCTPDRLVFPTADALAQRQIDRGLECKNRTYFNREAWGQPGTDEVPLEVAAQAHWSMLVTGVHLWDVAVLLGGNTLGIYSLAYDAALAAQLFEQAGAFWKNYVEPKVTPPLDGSSSSKAYLNRKWPMHSDALKPAPREIQEAAMSLKQVRAQIRDLQGADGESGEKARLENVIKDFIGEQAGVLLLNGERITWKRPKAGVQVNWENVALGLKAKATKAEWDLVVDLNSTQRAATRRFLCTFKEK